MAKLYLLRHGQSEWNILNKVQGQQNTALTEKGIEQAQKAAIRLIKENIDVIYSSDLKRAYQTAEVIGDKLSLEVNTLCGIREMNFGTWEGLPIETIERDHLDHYKTWRTAPHEITFVDGENLAKVQERALAAVNKIISETSHKNILLVSHGTAIKSLILDLSNSFCKSDLFNTFMISLCEFSSINCNIFLSSSSQTLLLSKSAITISASSIA